MNFEALPASKPEPAMKQSPKPSWPCLPRIAVAALVIIAGSLLAVLFV